MPPISDLVCDSRLDTRVLDDGAVHRYIEVAQGRRRVERKEQWTWQQAIGEGGFGRVWQEKCISGKNKGRLRAVKQVRKRLSSSRSIDYTRELEAVAKFSHPKYETCFVKSFGWYEDDDAIYIAMEYFPLGDLHAYMSRCSRLPPSDVQQVTYQVLEALEYMHNNGFAHRDVKPGNILIQSHPPQDWWVKLADFGISKRSHDEQAPSTVKGTRGYMAPELHGFRSKAERSRPLDFQAADVWAVGELSFELLSGRHAFPDIYAFTEYCRGDAACPVTELEDSVGLPASDLVASLMEVSANVRIRATAALEHPWLLAARNGTTDCHSDTLRDPVVQSGLVPAEEVQGQAQASARWTEQLSSSIPERRVETEEGLSSVGGHDRSHEPSASTARLIGRDFGVSLARRDDASANVSEESPGNASTETAGRSEAKRDQSMREMLGLPAEHKQDQAPPASSIPSQTMKLQENSLARKPVVERPLRTQPTGENTIRVQKRTVGQGKEATDTYVELKRLSNASSTSSIRATPYQPGELDSESSLEPKIASRSERCSYCLHVGHTKPSCPLLDMPKYAREKVDQTSPRHEGLEPTDSKLTASKATTYRTTAPKLKVPRAGPARIAKAVCTRCFKNGHEQPDCPERNNRRAGPICSICARMDHRPSSCPHILSMVQNEGPVCRHCCETGHELSECPILNSRGAEPICKACGGIGHEDRSCRYVLSVIQKEGPICRHCCETGHEEHYCPYINDPFVHQGYVDDIEAWESRSLDGQLDDYRPPRRNKSTQKGSKIFKEMVNFFS